MIQPEDDETHLNLIVLLGHKNTDNFLSISSSSLLLLLSISKCVQAVMEVLQCEYMQVGSAAVCSQLAQTDKVQGLGESCCCSRQFIYLSCDKASQPQWAGGWVAQCEGVYGGVVVGHFSSFRKSKLALCVWNENNIS